MTLFDHHVTGGNTHPRRREFRAPRGLAAGPPATHLPRPASQPPAGTVPQGDAIAQLPEALREARLPSPGAHAPRVPLHPPAPRAPFSRSFSTPCRPGPFCSATPNSLLPYLTLSVVHSLTLTPAPLLGLTTWHLYPDPQLHPSLQRRPVTFLNTLPAPFEWKAWPTSSSRPPPAGRPRGANAFCKVQTVSILGSGPSLSRVNSRVGGCVCAPIKLEGHGNMNFTFFNVSQILFF